MRVHHLNCGTMNAPGISHVVCHVLLCETSAGLVLVDTGVGTGDIADPAARIGPMRRLLRPAFDPDETAIARVRRLSHDPADVAHIVLTHLDFDHAGGLSDFPHATVHTTTAEHRAAMIAPRRAERTRYRPAQWAHRPTMQTYDGTGEAWRGFAGALPLSGIDGIALIPMAGHTRGHAAVAVDTGNGLLVHAGDAAFDGSSIGAQASDGQPLATMWQLRAFETLAAVRPWRIAANHRRLIELRTEPGATVFTAHDGRLLDAMAARA
jgi:glyoxylase-like metal-dependent hydrolase (beta-lactamase superfamily II)